MDNCLMADSCYTCLGVWRAIALFALRAIKEFLGVGHGVVGEFKVAGFDIDQYFLLFMRRV
jgi:hypothetical protein